MKALFLVTSSVLILLLTQCATQEVEAQLSENLERKGESFARELEAQSPFTHMKMSWAEASELMKERNPKYQQAILAQLEAESQKGLVGNFTSEFRKSLTASMKNTLNPLEIAKAMNNPLASLPRRLESVSDLKNISHSLRGNEWERLEDVAEARLGKRKELVDLHVLFCQSDNLKEAETQLQKVINSLRKNKKTKLDKASVKSIAKVESQLKKDKSTWLNDVRNFFHAEYYNVTFSNYTSKLDFYREVKDPNFFDWKRWCVLGNVKDLTTELKKKHDKEKPKLPGLGLVTQKLGITEAKSILYQDEGFNQDVMKDVRSLLKNWRRLKDIQNKLTAIPVVKKDQYTVVDLKELMMIYTLKNQEIKYLREFWMIDENCWRAEAD